MLYSQIVVKLCQAYIEEDNKLKVDIQKKIFQFLTNIF